MIDSEMITFTIKDNQDKEVGNCNIFSDTLQFGYGVQEKLNVITSGTQQIIGELGIKSEY